MNYRAVIDIDGNAWSGRAPRLMCSPTLLIRIVPEYVAYFQHQLIPNVHYLSATLEFNPNNHSEPLGNFTEVVKFAMAEENRPVIRQIVKNAQNWCRQEMLVPNLQHRFLESLDEYLGILDRSGMKWESEWREQSPYYLGNESMHMHEGFTTAPTRGKRRLEPLNRIVTGVL